MELDKYVGLPYKDKGRTVEGIDCWGLLVLVYREILGVNLPSYSTMYPSAADYAEISTLIGTEKLNWERVDKPQKYDVVLVRHGKYQSHVGLYLKNKRMLHVREEGFSVVENLNSPQLKNRVVGFYRYRKENEPAS